MKPSYSGANDLGRVKRVQLFLIQNLLCYIYCIPKNVISSFYFLKKLLLLPVYLVVNYQIT